MRAGTGKNGKKKGRPSWKPAGRLSMMSKLKGFRYRWCNNDADNIYRKQREGWDFVNPVTGITAEHEHPNETGDGSPMTSTPEYRELVAMALPEDVAKERDAYYAEQTDRQAASTLSDLKRDAKDLGGEVHGRIVIE